LPDYCSAGQQVPVGTVLWARASDTVLLMERPALIVIDMLNDFLSDWEPAPKEKLIQSINELVDLIRGLGHSVMWIRQEPRIRAGLERRVPGNES
jgi:hypothetical protein